MDALPLSGVNAPDLRSARSAQQDWEATPLRRRLAIIGRLRHSLPQALDDLLAALHHPQRRDDGESITSEILPLIDAVSFLQRRASSVLRPQRLGRRGAPAWLGRPSLELRRQAVGLVLVIGPANYPLFLPGVQALQALVAGNSVLVKPGRDGHAVAQLLGRLLLEAGLPRGCYTVLDPDPANAEQAIAAGVDLVLLTGSREVGQRVQHACADAGVPCILELSGADAVFILPQADLEATAEALAFALGLNSGATCIGPRRCFVTHDQLEDLAQRLRDCLVDHPAVAAGEQVVDLVARVAADGGQTIVGGSPEPGRLEPTVLQIPHAALPHFHRDLFAPVMALVAVHDMDEALRLDAACPYALGASVFGPPDAGRRLARRCRAGCVTINDLVVPTADPRLPFGGRKASGFGVTRGAEGLLALTRVQAISRGSARRLRRPRLDEASGRDLVRLLHGRGVSRLRALYRLARTQAGRQHIEEPT
jgi:acyl-CoA reductase-like NAD-dependent aldehyde dehydrogenase